MGSPGPLAIPCLVLAGANVAAGAASLFLYTRMRGRGEHLPFALLCFSVACYDSFCAGLYSARSIAQGIFWQRLQLLSFVPVSVFLLAFVGLATEARLNRLLRLFIGAFCVLGLAAVLFDKPGLTLSVATPSVKAITWGGRPIVTYYESEIGLLLTLGSVFFYVTYAAMLLQLYRAQRRTGSRYLFAILVGLLVYCVGLVNDTLVDTGLSQFFYISEWAYMALVSIMGFAMLERFVDLNREVEQLNAGLEQRVQEAVAQIKVLRGWIPICAGCRRLRSDGGDWQVLEEYFAESSEARFSHGMCPECIERLYPEVAERRARAARGEGPGPADPPPGG